MLWVLDCPQTSEIQQAKSYPFDRKLDKTNSFTLKENDEKNRIPSISPFFASLKIAQEEKMSTFNGVLTSWGPGIWMIHPTPECWDPSNTSIPGERENPPEYGGPGFSKGSWVVRLVHLQTGYTNSTPFESDSCDLLWRSLEKQTTKKILPQIVIHHDRIKGSNVFTIDQSLWSQTQTEVGNSPKNHCLWGTLTIHFCFGSILTCCENNFWSCKPCFQQCMSPWPEI